MSRQWRNRQWIRIHAPSRWLGRHKRLSTHIGGTPSSYARFVASDTNDLAAFLGGLSKQSIYSRYVSPQLYRNEAMLHQEAARLAGSDGVHSIAVVAQRCEDGRRLIIGVAELVRDARQPASAEVALVVADAHQGDGIGRALAAHVLAAGARRGIASVQALALAENVPLRRLVAGLELPFSAATRWGTTTFQIEVGPR